MAKEQNRTEIILEEIKSNFKALVDGQIQLSQQMERGLSDVRKELGDKIDDIQKTVKSHSVILNSHSDILQSHSDILKSHTEQLDEIKETADEIKADLKHHIRQAVPPAHIAF